MSMAFSTVAETRRPRRPAPFLAWAAAALVAVPAATGFGPAVGGERKAKALLELFTSQGCSSCPPADALLARLARRDDVVALTMPVTYWDNLGWKDTLACDAFTRRQRAYAEARGDRDIYTPQIVVNGIGHVVGSSVADVDATLQWTSQVLGEAVVALELRDDGEAMLIETGPAAPASAFRGGTVWFACFSRAVPVEIGRGENTGTRITYTNVVRYLWPAGRWEGAPVSYRMAIPGGRDIDGCAAFLEADGSKAMLGAAIVAVGHN